jgi:Zn-finger nucleic acid-binding protein
VSYRETALACPACGDVMAPQQVGEAIIDICASCGGIWVDWFDGELAALVRHAPPVEGAQPPNRPGRWACPRCHCQLAEEVYLQSGADILRCSDCSGAFVSRSAARTIARGNPEHKGPPPAEDALSRLAAVLQRWFGDI